MRLTLRTLLAYLDGILEPADAQDIGQKVKESEFASGLVQRIADVLRRPRLAAPKLSQGHGKLDPNTVSEYLDNTLVADAVTDFEKMCLESDIHLAEVAASHQILALVLGEPAEIDAGSRQQMYGLKDGPKAETVALPPLAARPKRAEELVSTVTTLDLGDVETAPRPRQKPVVPEYLREPRKRRRWVPVAMAAVLLFCLAVVGLILAGQFEPGTPGGRLLAMLGNSAQERQVAVAPQPEADEQAVMPVKTEPPPAEAAAAKNGVSPVPHASVIETEPPKAIGEMPAAVASPSEGTVKEPAKEPPADAHESRPETKKEQPKQPEKQPPQEPVKPASEAKQPTAGVAKPDVKEPSVKANAERATADVSTPPQPSPAVAVEPSVPQPPPAGIASGSIGEAEKKSEALPPEPFGRFVSSDQVLLKYGPDSEWTRVAANDVLQPGRLLVLPTYRAKLSTSLGVNLEILGGTQVELLAGDTNELPGIRVVFGRVVIFATAEAGAKLRVQFGERWGVLTIADSVSAAAVEVRHIRVPGTNPETKSPRIGARLYAAAGAVLWDETASKSDERPVRLKSPEWMSFTGTLTSAPGASNQLPNWIKEESMKALDRMASPVIAQLLEPNTSARIGLMELTARPQKEVRWLALRSLGYVGQFRDLVTALDDPAQRLEWSDNIEELRAAVGRDGETAAAVRLALEQQYPDQAEETYRMLWGYTDEDLKSVDSHQGEAAKLVDALEDDSLAVRVLSAWSLHDLTGQWLYYRPHDTAAKRRQPVAEWRKRLEANEIRLKTPEEKSSTKEE